MVGWPGGACVCALPRPAARRGLARVRSRGRTVVGKEHDVGVGGCARRGGVPSAGEHQVCAELLWRAELAYRAYARCGAARPRAWREREPGERDETTAAPTESIARTTISSEIEGDLLVTCQLMAFMVVSCAAVAVAVADHCALDQRSDQRERRLASTRSSTRRIERSTSEQQSVFRWYPSW